MKLKFNSEDSLRVIKIVFLIVLVNNLTILAAYFIFKKMGADANTELFLQSMILGAIPIISSGFLIRRLSKVNL